MIMMSSLLTSDKLTKNINNVDYKGLMMIKMMFATNQIKVFLKKKWWKDKKEN